MQMKRENQNIRKGVTETYMKTRGVERIGSKRLGDV